MTKWHVIQKNIPVQRSKRISKGGLCMLIHFTRNRKTRWIKWLCSSDWFKITYIFIAPSDCWSIYWQKLIWSLFLLFSRVFLFEWPSPPMIHSDPEGTKWQSSPAAWILCNNNMATKAFTISVKGQITFGATSQPASREHGLPFGLWPTPSESQSPSGESKHH